MKAISSLKTLGDKMDYIDTYFEPGSWLCTRCGMPRPASESKCQAMTKAGYVDVDGRALWTQCTGSQVSSWGGLFRAADSRPECPRTLLEYTRAGEKGRLSGGSRYAREVAKIELLEGEREGQVEPERMALVTSVFGRQGQDYNRPTAATRSRGPAHGGGRRRGRLPLAVLELLVSRPWRNGSTP